MRIIAASFSELGNDEVYYWTYSQHLQWNYFDHPPMVAIWIRFFTANLSLEKFEVFIRLGSIIGCIISTVFIFQIGKNLHSEKAGWFAACLDSLTLYNFIAIPMISIFIVMSFLGDTLPHWSGPAYIALIPLAAIYLCKEKTPIIFPKQIKWALSFIFFLLPICLLINNFYPG